MPDDKTKVVYSNKNTIQISQPSNTTQTVSVDNVSFQYTEVKSLTIQGIRNILGAPHQFMNITDYRFTKENSNNQLGYTYIEHIIKTIPILFMQLGVPKFMPEATSSARESILQSVGNARINPDMSGSFSGKYYTFEEKMGDYFNYVNTMLRAAAVFLRIEQETIDSVELRNFHWMSFSSDTNVLSTISSINSSMANKLYKSLGYATAVALYAYVGDSVQDSFVNSTAPSQLEGMANGLSDQAREVNFLTGNVGAALGQNSSNGLGGAIKDTIDSITNALGAGGVIKSVLNKAQIIASGGRLVFPEIWSDSQFGRTYSCNMKLVSPSGDKLSIFMNLLVPMYHLLAMTLPRNPPDAGVTQSYISPFIVRAYFKGYFNIDMGIITNLSITRGAEAEWTVDGIPTVLDISFDIKDLYDGFYMSRGANSFSDSIMTNITELDYIANSCGININSMEQRRAGVLWWTLNFANMASDIVQNMIFNTVGSTLNNFLNRIFGMF